MFARRGMMLNFSFIMKSTGCSSRVISCLTRPTDIRMPIIMLRTMFQFSCPKCTARPFFGPSSRCLRGTFLCWPGPDTVPSFDGEPIAGFAVAEPSGQESTFELPVFRRCTWPDSWRLTGFSVALPRRKGPAEGPREKLCSSDVEVLQSLAAGAGRASGVGARAAAPAGTAESPSMFCAPADHSLLDPSPELALENRSRAPLVGVTLRRIGEATCRGGVVCPSSDSPPDVKVPSVGRPSTQSSGMLLEAVACALSPRPRAAVAVAAVADEGAGALELAVPPSRSPRGKLARMPSSSPAISSRAAAASSEASERQPPDAAGDDSSSVSAASSCRAARQQSRGVHQEPGACPRWRSGAPLLEDTAPPDCSRILRRISMRSMADLCIR
mmetsp:Transcript_23123/g.65756  ORF Transcript_23123/g.65756 Transcript_23123/m.65756 type:complete len:385 (+) Transcript_23123:1239-2393(+)